MKKATSKSRFEREETALEKSEEKEGLIKTATKKIVSPIGNIFKKLIAFLGILGKGIATNAVFEFFKDEENQKRITKIFNILKENWQLLVKILATIAGFAIIGKAIGLLTTGLALLPGLAIAAGIGYALMSQDLGKQQRKLVDKLEEMGGVTPENRKKLIAQLKEERKQKLSGPLGGVGSRITGEISEIDNAIRFLETGEYGYGKRFEFNLGLPFNYQTGGQANPETLQQENPFDFLFRNNQRQEQWVVL